MVAEGVLKWFIFFFYLLRYARVRHSSIVREVVVWWAISFKKLASIK